MNTTVVTSILLFWLLALTVFFLYLYLSWRRIFKGSSGKTLQEALQRYFTQAMSLKNKTARLEKEVSLLQEEKRAFFQKSAFLRFNPFGDTGGDQSFVWAILDENDNGFVLSSLHGRGNTRVYAKLIKNGEAVQHKLSKEEQKVLDQARLSKR